jgi:hypothetical protein
MINDKLIAIADELHMLRNDVVYPGFDPDQIRTEEAIALLATKMIELIEIIQSSGNHESGT